MIELEFNCLKWTKEQLELNSLGIRPPLEEVAVECVVFYSISSIAAYFEGHEMTCIISDGEEFIVDLPLNEVRHLIRQSKSKSKW